jgi:hypothetical protein
MTATSNPLPSKHGEHGMPRRCCIDANHAAELAIRAAVREVESLGADPLLTDAVTKLTQAQERVADWLEGLSG